jgi:hypothetical protein
VQGVVQVAAVGLFAAGLVFGMPALQFASFLVFALLALVAAWAGIMTPAGTFASLGILVVGALLLTPWWLGFTWFQFVMGILGLPKSLAQVFAPEEMLRREGRPPSP